MKWKAMNELDYGLATSYEGTQTLKQNCQLQSGTSTS